MYGRVPSLCVHGTYLLLWYGIVYQNVCVVEPAELRGLKNVLWRVLKIELACAVAPFCTTLRAERSGEVEAVISHVGVVFVAVERSIDRTR